jgi:hypothetical protein
MEPTHGVDIALVPILLFLFIGIPVAILLVVLPFWFICKKAGFHGALSLLMLVPIGNIVLPFVLAFAEWPAFKAQENQLFEEGV